MNQTFLCFVSICLVVTNANFFNFQECKRSDPNIDDCLKTAIQLALLVLENGVPELEIPSMQPFLVPKLVMYLRGVINFKGTYENVLCFNHASSKINSVESNISDDDLWIKIKGSNPEIRYVADYVYKDAIMNGINVSSSGTVSYTQHGYVFEMVMSGSIQKKEGFKQLVITDLRVNMTAKNMLIVYKNADPDLSKQMSEFVTNNWSKLFEAVKDQFAAVYADIYKTWANAIFSKVDFDELFPK